jgi:sulfofructose kinase
MFDVVGVGANSIDYVGVVRLDPPRSTIGGKVRLRRHARLGGGQAVTTLAACARLGLRCAYVGATGSDANGRLAREALERSGVDVSNTVVRDGFNQFAFIIVDERTGERTVLWDRDERLNLQPAQLPRHVLASARLVHVDDVDEGAAIAAAAIAREHAIPVTSDIDRLTGRTLDLVDAVSVAIFAENVPLQLTGRASVHEALGSMKRREGQTLCVTRGSNGCVALDDDGLHEHAGFRVKAVDTTAAGDVFRAGFIYGVLQGWGIEKQLRFANAAAATSCTRLGAITSAPSLEEVEVLLRT